MSRRASLAALLAVATLGASPMAVARHEAVASFVLPRMPYVPGSIIPLDVDGLSGPYGVDLLGPGHLSSSNYFVPADANGTATLFAADASAVAMVTPADGPSLGTAPAGT